MADFLEPSPEIMRKFKETEDNRGRKSFYPWEDLPIGRSFAVDKAKITFKGLRSLAYKASARHKKVFRVYEHATVYEVSRLPDPIIEPKFLELVPNQVK